MPAGLNIYMKNQEITDKEYEAIVDGFLCKTTPKTPTEKEVIDSLNHTYRTWVFDEYQDIYEILHKIYKAGCVTRDSIIAFMESQKMPKIVTELIMAILDADYIKQDELMKESFLFLMDKETLSEYYMSCKIEEM